MAKSCTHLTPEERYYIKKRLKAGDSLSAIASQLENHRAGPEKGGPQTAPPRCPVGQWSVRGAAQLGAACGGKDVFVAVRAIRPGPLAGTVPRPALAGPNRIHAAAQTNAANGKAAGRTERVRAEVKAWLLTVVQTGGHLEADP